MSRPKPSMMLDSLAVEESADVTSYNVNHTNVLELRAFLFRNGSVYTRDGLRELHTQVSATDIDMSSRRPIGRGASGQVFFATLKGTQRPVAMKYIPITSKPHRDEVERELAFFAARSDSPFVMHNLGAYWDSEDNAIVLVMDWMSFNLHDVAVFWKDGGMDESFLRDVSYQVLRGLDYLHSAKRVIHRDIKPMNILIRDDGYVKIGDFGVSKMVETLGILSSYVGTMYFMAPERLEQGHYTFNSDMWSFGLTVISTARGGGNPWAPPESMNLFQLLQKISGNDIPVLGTRTAAYSDAAREFVAACLERSPEVRPDCKELLRHRFFEGVNEASAVEGVRSVVQLMSQMLGRETAKQADTNKTAAEVAALRDERIGRLDNL
jgi:serine/threonine protein kinase